MTKARDIATSEVVTGEIGSTIQAHDADLDSIAALDKTDGNVIVGDGTNWVAESGATARTSLGLGTAATTASTDYATSAQGTKADSALQPGDIGTSVLSPTGDGSGLTGIAGGFSNLQVFNAPGTWTNPGNVQKVKVTVQAGGGAGCGSAQNMGGAGGGCAIEVIPFPSATNVPVTVGNGGTVNYGNGNAGGTSSFGSYCSANGGAGGTNSVNLYTAGGTGVGGTLNFPGQGGSSHPYNNRGGQGGNSYLGTGGAMLTSNQGDVVPKRGTFGGGGSATSQPGQRGSNGGAGVVIVEY